MLKQWIERRKERKEMRQLSAEMEANKAKKLQYLELCKWMDADSPEQMIRFAEALRMYVERP